MSANFMERHQPTLAEQVDAATREGIAAARANPAAASRSVSDSERKGQGSPCCFSCGASIQAPDGVCAQMFLCEECADRLGKGGVEMLVRAFRVGSCWGAEWQRQQGAATIAAAQTELSRVNQSAAALLKEVSKTLELAQRWRAFAISAGAAAALFFLAWMLTLALVI